MAWEAPRSRNVRAARSASAMVVTGEPKNAAASSALILTPAGPAHSASASNSPPMSTQTGRPSPLAAITSRAIAPVGAAGGRLPQMATAAQPASAAARTSSVKCSQSPASRTGPGSLMTVAAPRSSTTMMQVRVSPAIQVQAAFSPSRRAPSAARQPASPPSSPAQRTRWPSRRSARATFTPLPPQLTCEERARTTEPAARLGTLSSRSIATLGVTQRMVIAASAESPPGSEVAPGDRLADQGAVLE